MERLKEVDAVILEVAVQEFTFQYGEIKRGFNIFGGCRAVNLHSSMERLKVIEFWGDYVGIVIYIPVWRD